MTPNVSLVHAASREGEVPEKPCEFTEYAFFLMALVCLRSTLSRNICRHDAWTVTTNIVPHTVPRHHKGPDADYRGIAVEAGMGTAQRLPRNFN